ncbi:cytochrome P450 [Bradyrhizobium prioriisuperbiae]|uniref:cytochrome P450 n=1 Tax=Bradyrhizobium prioriisuperbiae TaxID=2854389 RepID=UPI0028E31983|nr:cytochrome P450 [Bradyrhizobium prioritasuperba]
MSLVDDPADVLAEIQKTPAARTPLVPPRPPLAPQTMSTLRRLTTMRTNGIATWSERAYQEDMLQGSFFGRSSFTLNSPAWIRHVLIDNYENYRRTPAGIRVLQPMLGEGLLLAEGKTWKHQRRTLAPAFTPRAVNTLVPHMLDVTNETIQELAGQQGQPIDLREAMQRMTLEIAGRTMFSFGMTEHGTALRNFVIEYSANLARPRLFDLLLPLGWPTFQDIQRRFFRRRWTSFVRKLIVERRATAKPDAAPRDLFDLMVGASDPETGQAFSDDNLIDQVATMILAGHETTATALFWSLYLLAQDPASQDEVAREARAARTAGGEPEIEQLKFTRAVLDETMRLYPPAYLIARSASGPDVIDGKAVKKGDAIFIAPWLLHRHQKLWDNPDAFIPQRFLSGTAPDRFAYLPFGVGPRVCIGAHFALVESTLALAKIVGQFRIELLSTQPVMPVGVVTTQPDYSPMFSTTQR